MFPKIKNTLKTHLETLFRVFLSMVLRTASAVVMFVFTLILARNLGAEQAGYFFISLSAAVLLSSFASMGLENTVLRFTGAEPTNGKVIKSTLNHALKYIFFIGFSLSSIFFLLSPFLSETIFQKPRIELSLKYIAPSIMGLSMATVIAMSLQARQLLLSSVSCRGLSFPLICIVAVLISREPDAADVAGFYSLSLLSTTLVFYWLAVRKIEYGGGEVSTHLFWQSSMPNWVTNISNQTIHWAPLLVVGVFLSSQEAAHYGVAQRISMLVSFFLSAVNLVIAPKFSELTSRGDIDDLRKITVFASRLVTFCAMPVVVSLLLFPEKILVLFGAEFKQGASILQILLLGQVVNILTGPVGYLLMMSGNERDVTRASFVSGFGLLLVIPLFVKIYGVIGAAVIFSFFVSLQSLISVYFVKKRFGFNALRIWQKI